MYQGEMGLTEEDMTETSNTGTDEWQTREVFLLILFAEDTSSASIHLQS
jgi:hypothetical protein